MYQKRSCDIYLSSRYFCSRASAVREITASAIHILKGPLTTSIHQTLPTLPINNNNVSPPLPSQARLFLYLLRRLLQYPPPRHPHHNNRNRHHRLCHPLPSLRALPQKQSQQNAPAIPAPASADPRAIQRLGSICGCAAAVRASQT